MNRFCMNCHWYNETDPKHCRGNCSYRPYIYVNCEFGCDGFIDKKVDFILNSIQHEIHQRGHLFNTPVIILSYPLFKMIQALNIYLLSHDSDPILTLFGIKVRIAYGDGLFYGIGDEVNFEDL